MVVGHARHPRCRRASFGSWRRPAGLRSRQRAAKQRRDDITRQTGLGTYKAKIKRKTKEERRCLGSKAFWLPKVASLFHYYSRISGPAIGVGICLPPARQRSHAPLSFSSLGFRLGWAIATSCDVGERQNFGLRLAMACNQCAVLLGKLLFPRCSPCCAVLSKDRRQAA